MSLWCVAAVAASQGSARADAAYAQQFALIWHAPEAMQCGSGEQMRARVARLSDVPLTLSASAATYRIEVVVSKPSEAWQADVKMLDAQAHTLRARMVQGRTPSCSSVDVATAVVIATMLDSVPRDLARTHSADGGRLSLGTFAAISPELIPKAFIGGGVALETGTVIQLAFSASIYAPRQQLDARGRGAGLWGFHAGAALCPAAVRSNFLDLHLCAGAQAGAVVAAGVGLTQREVAAVPLLLLHAGPKMSLKVTPSVAVQLSASAAWAFVRPKITWNVEGEPAHVLRGTQIALLAQLGVTISPW